MTDSRVPDLSAVQSPPRRNIDYRTIKEGDRIGSGGQAVVRRSEVQGTEAPQTVAVKEPLQPPDTIDPQILESFFEEAETWKRLDTIERQKQTGRESEHIVGVVDIGDNLPWIAMEYMDGGSLKDRLETHPDGLPVEEALWIGECLCRGLKVAHDRGVAHLDLKPANILFRTTGSDTWDVPKIADWGLARVLLNHSGSIDGFSVEYAAPEQFDSDQFGDPDKYTDIYQLGAVVYELLTGDPPYTGGHASVMHDVLDDEDPVPPSTHRDCLPQTADEVVLRALSMEKSARYRGSVDRFEETLHAIRQGTQTTSGWTTGGTPSSTQADVSVTIEWTFQMDRLVTSSPAVADGTVYVGSWDYHVYALDAADGSTQWTYRTDNWVKSSPAVADGTVYVGSSDFHVYALSAADGSTQWTFETDGWVKSSPAVADGIVYVGSGDTHVYALSAADGSREWAFQTDGWVHSSPTVADGTVYVGSHDGHVYALDATEGSMEWTFQTDRKVISSPAVVDSIVYLRVGDTVHALSTADGSTEWTFKTGRWGNSSPAVADGSVYIESGDTVHALSAADGSTQWTFETGNWISSSPIVADSTVYVGSKNGPVYAVSTADGSEKWMFEPDDSVRSSPAIADGTIYVGSEGTVYALSER